MSTRLLPASNATYDVNAAALPTSDAIRPERIDLLDGRSVVLTPVQPRDCAAERTFVGALSQDSRYRRFHFGLRELPTEMARAMTEIDQHHHVAIAARPATSGIDGEIVADARYVMQADGPDAEFAIAVADAWQGAGLGRELLQRLVAQAAAQGIQRLFGSVLWGNTAMLGLVRSLGGRLRRNPGDATTLRVEFSAAPLPARAAA
jgi:acetyltransferase